MDRFPDTMPMIFFNVFYECVLVYNNSIIVIQCAFVYARGGGVVRSRCAPKTDTNLNLIKLGKTQRQPRRGSVQVVLQTRFEEAEIVLQHRHDPRSAGTGA